ncbi:alcohol dehydrogenase [Lacticaseibacillus mingshuiensis]|uniref:alcohol dehydrogenase n=1 Tax=Lacticaseibacillus mingshuiensis TaxID=2799574 RepID=UPI001CECFE41|nr:alcohol dehydrogenase [Lacticaseibacillus mingshuiensis]
MTRRIDLTGKRFGRLVVVSWVGHAGNGNAMWHCQCDCGNTLDVDSYRLRRGTTQSCGCLRRERSREVMLTTPVLREHAGCAAQLGVANGTNVSASLNIRVTNRSGVVGVSFDQASQTWNARLMVRGRIVLNQRFHRFNEAVAARREAEARYFPDRTRTALPPAVNQNTEMTH